ncbi:MAG: DUF2490 domain-containing protein [Gilvibacter sp.]
MSKATTIRFYLASIISLTAGFKGLSQTTDFPLGGWYTYNWNTQFKETPWGLDGEVQYTGFEVVGDLDWLLVRAGVTYQPKGTNLKFAVGYGHATFGVFGPANNKVTENRTYQQLNMPQKFGKRFYFLHRFRYEQRFFRNDLYRSRLRYGLFLNIPLNNSEFNAKTWYLSLYDELFLNGERQLNDGRVLSYFDQNRIYGAVGYVFKKGLSARVGFMRRTTNSADNAQLQVSVHHKF